MTEYDFSPEAYQAHLENMSRISRWVDRTEEHRAEFGNAAALDEDQLERTIRDSSPSPSPERRNNFGGRRRKVLPPLPLHPYGTSDPMYTSMGIRQFGMSPYGSPIMHSADDQNLGFVYGRGPGSPGTIPMYGHGYPGYPMPHSAGAQMMTMAPPAMSPALVSPQPSPPHHHHGHSRRSRANSFSLAPPAPFMTAPLSRGYVQATPNVVILPSTSSRHHRSGRQRVQPRVSYVYV